MHATYLTLENRPTLRFERDLAHPVEAVWSAITEPSELRQWFPCDVEVDLRLGGAMKFIFSEMPLADAPATMEGRVTELEPPRRFSFLWGEDHLHFQLAPSARGCRLTFTVILDAQDKAARDGAGWHVCLDGLERLLAGEKPGRSDDWAEHYREYERRGFPTGAALPADGM
jgi:uncharacterized protein YndB with AHSA1/START domain